MMISLIHRCVSLEATAGSEIQYARSASTGCKIIADIILCYSYDN